MWTRLDDRFFFHPKVQAAGKDATLLYLAGLTYSAGQLTDGFLNRAAVRICAGMVDVAVTEAETLVQVGLWEPTNGGYLVHDFRDYNPSAEEVKAKREDISRIRSEAGKKGMASRWGRIDGDEAEDNKITNGITTEVTNEPGVITNPYQTDNPVARSPQPVNPNPVAQPAQRVTTGFTGSDDGAEASAGSFSGQDGSLAFAERVTAEMLTWAKGVGFEGGVEELQGDTDRFVQWRREKEGRAPDLKGWLGWVRDGIKRRAEKGIPLPTPSPPPKPPQRTCEFPGCHKYAFASGQYCTVHGTEASRYRELEPFHQKRSERGAGSFAALSEVLPAPPTPDKSGALDRR